MGFSPNIPVLVTCGASVALLFVVRHVSFFYFVMLIAIPGFVYGLLAEQTKQTPLHNSVILVTGASSGLGFEIAKEAARRGCLKIFFVARTKSKLDTAAKECKIIATNKNFEAKVLPCDLYSSDAMRALVTSVLAECPALDLLVNNAGAGAWKHTEETTPEEALQMMGCPLQAAFCLSSLFAPAMAKANTGHILNITSAASLLGFRGGVGYATSRWAVRGFSRCLSCDMKQLGIGVTLMNAAEITGTDYFKDAPGKAGASSKNKIPALFQFIDDIGLNSDAAATAATALDGVEKGYMEVLHPHFILYPTVWLYNIMPGLVEYVCGLGSPGWRQKRNHAD